MARACSQGEYLMDTVKALRHLCAYNQWANLLTIDSLKDSSNSSPKALQALTHLLIAEREWLWRLEENRDTTGFNFWPELSLDECQALMDENHKAYTSLLDNLAEDDLERTASYKNSKGVAYRTSYRDILTHVFSHSCYHRGQVAMAIRAGGGRPAYTDYIAWVREQEEIANARL